MLMKSETIGVAARFLIALVVSGIGAIIWLQIFPSIKHAEDRTFYMDDRRTVVCPSRRCRIVECPCEPLLILSPEEP